MSRGRTRASCAQSWHLPPWPRTWVTAVTPETRLHQAAWVFGVSQTDDRTSRATTQRGALWTQDWPGTLPATQPFTPKSATTGQQRPIEEQEPAGSKAAVRPRPYCGRHRLRDAKRRAARRGTVGIRGAGVSTVHDTGLPAAQHRGPRTHRADGAGVRAGLWTGWCCSFTVYTHHDAESQSRGQGTPEGHQDRGPGDDD